ncbi:MAG: flavodoxin family protein, partial [Chloroflexi bacterium]|nr:flavodoxin family protein [Chloroflexota bacterium]
MRIVMLSGSRAAASTEALGKTQRVAEALLAGAGQAGAEVERFFLPDLRVERCRQCDPTGWGLCRREGRCVIEDDLTTISARLRAADAV